MNQSLRFCMMTTFYPPYSMGGDAVFVKRLSNELARRGHKVDVIHCIDSHNLLKRQDAVEAAQDHPNVTLHSIRSPFGPLSPLATQQTGLPFFKSSRIRKVLESGFDVIHYHNISLLGPKVLEYGSAVKLYTMHEYWLICPTHVLFRFNRAPCVSRRCISCSLSYIRPPQWWRYTGLLERAVKEVDAFIAPSLFGKQMHQQMMVDAPIVHLPSFVPQEHFQEEQETEPPAKPYFLFVGRLEKIKGLQTLIPLFRRFGRADLLIAGSGTYQSRLHELAAGCAQIKFLGHQTEGQLRTLYRGALAVIVPSICFEMFPLVILEAFRHSTPVVARNIGGMPEIIEESGGGVTYSSDEKLLASLERFFADARYRRELGMRGYETFKSKWTVEAHLQEYFNLISKLSDAKKPQCEAAVSVYAKGRGGV